MRKHWAQAALDEMLSLTIWERRVFAAGRRDKLESFCWQNRRLFGGGAPAHFYRWLREQLAIAARKASDEMILRVPEMKRPAAFLELIHL